MAGQAARRAGTLIALLLLASGLSAFLAAAQGPGAGGAAGDAGSSAGDASGNATGDAGSGNTTGDATGNATGNATGGGVSAGVDLDVGVTSEGPDLRAMGLLTDPVRLDANVTATFTARIANTGNRSSNATTVRFLIDDEALGDATLPILDAGANVTARSAPWVAIEGNHTLTVRVDPANISGQDPDALGNDVANFSLQVGPAGAARADLIVLDVAPEDSHPQPGGNLTFKARIANIGVRAAEAFNVTFLLDDRILGNASVPGLLAGEGASVRSPVWQVSGGNHTVAAFADPADVVPEQNEGNNELRLPFHASDALFVGADLRVGQVLLDPPQPLGGTRLNFTVTIENPGTPVASTFAVLFLMDNATLDRQLVHGLDTGATVTLRVSWRAEPGPHLFLAQADPEDTVGDTTRLNNALPFSFVVPTRDERADLVLDLLTAPADVGVGQQVQFSAVVRNQGTWPSITTTVKFLVDGQALGNARLDPLPPGATARVSSKPWNATRGAHVLLARVDPGHAVPELDDVNNTLARNLTVPTIDGLDVALLPDPAVVKVRWRPLQPQAGDSVVVEAVVENTANGTAGPFRITFLLDGKEFDAQRVPGVGSAQVQVLSKAWRAEAGRHTLGARLDLLDGFEREEGNDVAYAVLDVPSTGMFSSLGNASFVDLMLPAAAGAVVMLVALHLLHRRGRGKAEPPTPGP